MPTCKNDPKKTGTETSMYVGCQSGLQSSKDVKPTVSQVCKTHDNMSTKRPPETRQSVISQNVPLSQKDVQPSTVSLKKTITTRPTRDHHKPVFLSYHKAGYRLPEK